MVTFFSLLLSASFIYFFLIVFNIFWKIYKRTSVKKKKNILDSCHNADTIIIQGKKTETWLNIRNINGNRSHIGLVLFRDIIIFFPIEVLTADVITEACFMGALYFERSTWLTSHLSRDATCLLKCHSNFSADHSAKRSFQSCRNKVTWKCCHNNKSTGQHEMSFHVCWQRCGALWTGVDSVEH